MFFYHMGEANQDKDKCKILLSDNFNATIFEDTPSVVLAKTLPDLYPDDMLMIVLSTTIDGKAKMYFPGAEVKEPLFNKRYAESIHFGLKNCARQMYFVHVREVKGEVFFTWEVTHKKVYPGANKNIQIPVAGSLMIYRMCDEKEKTND
jgi:hypothetical protein